MERKERNELSDKFEEAADMVFVSKCLCSCGALWNENVHVDITDIYRDIFSPYNIEAGGYWLNGEFRTGKAKQKWRVAALLHASEMIRQGMFFKKEKGD